MMGWYGQGMGPGFVFMAIGSLLFWILTVAAAVLLVRFTTRWAAQSHVGDTARQVLNERYARGEIDDEEYQRRLRMLAA